MRRILLLAAAAFTLAGTGSLTSTVQAQDDPAAAEWCASHGGTVVDRYPASMASTDAPISLGPPVRFCEFTGGEGADPADSRISVRLTTLASSEASMAATAYLTKPAMPESGGSANPASVYCADLGGSEDRKSVANSPLTAAGSTAATPKTSSRCASSPTSRSSTPGASLTTPWAPSAGQTWNHFSAGTQGRNSTSPAHMCREQGSPPLNTQLD
jgi:putative hemolysin